MNHHSRIHGDVALDESRRSALPLGHEAVQSRIGRVTQVLVSPHLGGAARIALLLDSGARLSKSTRSRVLVPEGGDAFRAARAAGAEVATYNERALHSRGAHALVESLMCTLRLRGSDVIHVHSPFVYGALRRSFGALRARTVVHIHLDYTAEQLRWALRVPPDLIIACARYMLSAVDEALPPRRRRPKVVVVPNAVDLARFAAGDRTNARAKVGAVREHALAMIVANLSPHKGQETAIRAIAALNCGGTRAHLWIVGEERGATDGAYTGYLRTLAAQLGVDSAVRFLGFRSDVPELLRAADFVLLPSTSEGMPLTLLEARAAGCVVLAAPTAGVPEIIQDGVDGFLLGARDVAGYTAALRALIDDPPERGRVAAAATQRVLRDHGAEAFVDRVFGHYEEIAGRRILSKRVT